MVGQVAPTPSASPPHPQGLGVGALRTLHDLPPLPRTEPPLDGSLLRAALARLWTLREGVLGVATAEDVWTPQEVSQWPPRAEFLRPLLEREIAATPKDDGEGTT
jgi:hypothetical protein